MMNSPKAPRDKIKKSLFDEPEDGPFCEEIEAPALPPELRDMVMTSIPEIVPAEPEPEPTPETEPEFEPKPVEAAPLPEPEPQTYSMPTARRDCGCPPIPPPEPPEPPVPGTLPPEAPLPPDSPYVYVENDYGEIAAMWKNSPDVRSAEELPEPVAEAALPAEAPKTEEAPIAEEIPAEQASAPEPVSPFQSVSLPEPEARPIPRPEPRPEPRQEPKLEPWQEPRPREVWRMG